MVTSTGSTSVADGSRSRSTSSSRTQASVGPKTNLISKLRRLAAIHCKWTQDIGCARFCQAMSTLVPGSVNTSPSLQKTQLPDWDSSQAVSTLVPGSVDTSLSFQKNSFAEMGQYVDTLPGGVDTLRLKLKNVNFSEHVAAWELGDLT
ncbi:hypothetical protein Taro_037887 [Colocasia esculenta]|uniref:Uncharacterized protein n=1 Tax=Colocasia esculenta TaxID=4460 RepID=A0A843WR20_COLES|nr:hypothetical protein [Colocasia esculenta]